MDNSIYVALSRQMALFRDLDTTANNIANVDTNGYQAEKTMFTDYLVSAKGFDKQPDVAFTQDIATYHDTTQGTIMQTGNALDVAISGDGYFVVETGQGERYTRNGSFHIDPQGTMMTAEGYPVLDDAGQRIQLNEEDQEVTFGENGLIVVDGEERGILGLVEFPNRQALSREGTMLFKSDIPGQQTEESKVLHGALEKSNVQPVSELVRLTQLSKQSGQTSKFIEVMYDLQRKSSNTWTKQS